MTVPGFLLIINGAAVNTYIFDLFDIANRHQCI